MDDATARREIPLTDVERLHGEYRVALLKNDWPFVAERRPTTLPTPASRIEEIAQAWLAGRLDWLRAMEEALAWYRQQGNATEAARVAVNLADAVVNDAGRQYAAGLELLKANEPARGEHYLGRAVALDGARLEYRLSLAQSHFMQGRVQDSIAALEAAARLAPEDPRVQYWLDEMRRAAGR